jgi:hypothetical protein
MNANTPNTPNTNDDGFATLALALAGIGHSLEPRTRLAFGKNAASALAGIVTGGYVVVMCEGTTNADADKYAALIAASPKNMVALIDARTASYARVRPNVSTFVKSRKLNAAITPPVKNADGDAYAFLIRKNG